ncbi:DNA-directed RNA polymerase III subunit RPC8-like isoform X1 [Nyctibius grandis]|uniref:DNA-directed RNA polymerase III subunit RPC8-like isoform X1 n=1 Tax=Nyctibius grandis TaxID=48427 RepID=UPI0035BBA38F
MFVLAEMTDTVRIPPWQFERKLTESIAEELNKKLANKVVYNVGLCICLYDITKLEDSYIFPGDGASHTKVHFRYVVFHPFLDEILIGQIKSCSQDGVHVSIGFFDDIVIPPESLQQPAKFYPLVTFDNFTTSFQKIVQCWPNRHSLLQQGRCSVAEAKPLCQGSPADCYHSWTGLTLLRFCRISVPADRNDWQCPPNDRVVIPASSLGCCC